MRQGSMGSVGWVRACLCRMCGVLLLALPGDACVCVCACVRACAMHRSSEHPAGCSTISMSHLCCCHRSRQRVSFVSFSGGVVKYHSKSRALCHLSSDTSGGGSAPAPGAGRGAGPSWLSWLSLLVPGWPPRGRAASQHYGSKGGRRGGGRALQRTYFPRRIPYVYFRKR